MRFDKAVLWVAASLAVVCSCQPKPNPVADYLDGAQIKATPADVDKVVRTALTDMTVHSAQDLRMFRYADEKGQPTVDLRTVLKTYFVPSGAKVLPEDDSFYDSLAAPRTRELAKGLLVGLERDRTR
jgi:hypothetical protein